MMESSQQRFLGFYPGQTDLRLCYTRPNFEHSSGYSGPRPLTFDGGKSEGIPPLLELPGQECFDGGGDLLHHLTASTILAQATLSAIEDPSWAVLLQTLANRVGKLPAFSGVNLRDCSLTVASPANPAIEPKLAAAIEAAGFPTPTFSSPAIAAVLDLLYMGWLPWAASQQSWLVIDSAATETRFSLVEHPADSPARLSLKCSLSLEWGGALYDQALLDGLLLPAWQGMQPPSEEQKRSLLFLAAAIKQNYSQHIPSVAVLNHNYEGLLSPLELNQDRFDELCEALNQRWWELLNGPELAAPEFGHLDGIILVGGSANWKFVYQGIKNRWPGILCLRPDKPALSIARGLALAQTNFVPPEPASIPKPEETPSPQVVEPEKINFQQPGLPGITHAEKEETPNKSGWIPVGPKAGGSKAFTKAELDAIHHDARKAIRIYVLIGATFALLVSWLPFAAWPVLLALEVHMFIKIASKYKQRLETNALWFLLGGLLLVSFLLSWVIAEAISFLSAYVAAPIVKPLIAGLVIWGLGEGAIYILDQQRS